MQNIVNTLALFLVVLAISVAVVIAAPTSNSGNLTLVIEPAVLPTELRFGSAVYDGDDAIYVIGGFAGNTPENRVFKYSLSTENVEVVGVFMGVGRGRAIMDGQDILYFGGSLGLNQQYAEHFSSGIFKFSTVSRSTTLLTNMPKKIQNFALAHDANNRLAYIFGGQNESVAGFQPDILQYNLDTAQLDQVGQLPQPRSAFEAVWDPRQGMAYMFGGWTPSMAGLQDILQYSPPATVSKLTTRTPSSPNYPCAALTNDGKMYVAGILAPSRGLIKFDPVTKQVEQVPVNGWPYSLQGAACVYVPKLARLYIIGGEGNYRGVGESYGSKDKIGYIQIGEPKPEELSAEDCSDGQTKLIPNPFCCESFHICIAGVASTSRCPDGLQFSPDTLKCKESAEVGCRNSYNKHK